MEMNRELILLQGLITSLQKNQDDFSKIKYKGGNEMKICKLCDALKQFLITHEYINNNFVVNVDKNSQLNDLLVLLVLNTEFSKGDYFNDEELFHLRQVMPQLSRCVLINIIVELNLTANLLEALERFSLDLLIDVSNEVLTTLKKVRSDLAIAHLFPIVKSVIKRTTGLSMNDFKKRELVGSLGDVVSALLLHVSGVNSDKLEGLTRKKIYRHVGFVLIELLQLLLACQVEDFAHAKIIDELLKSTMVIMSAVNVDVFIEWAEVEHQGVLLQLRIAESAYGFIQKYAAFKPAKECTEMFKQIARKPKSLRESIQEASAEKIIDMIDAQDENQRHWFSALINTRVFDNSKSIDCLARNLHLCQIDDVVRLLKLGGNCKDNKIKRLVIKSAENLSKDDLILALSRYYSFVGLKSDYEHSNVCNELLLILNKIKSEPVEVTTKQILLLFIENPLEVIRVISHECVNNNAYNSWLTPIFHDMRVLLSFELAALNALHEIIKARVIELPGLQTYIAMLLGTDVSNAEEIIGRILKPLLEDYINDKNDGGIHFILELLKDLSVNKISDDLNAELLYLLVTLLETNRCKFASFNESNIGITIKTVAVLKNLQEVEQPNESMHNLSPLNKFYVKHVDTKFLDYVYGSFSIENETEALAKLLKVLSKCVPEEWVMIVGDLCDNHGVNKGVELVTTVVILISQVTSAAGSPETCQSSQEAFKFYLQCYGIAIKNLQESYKSNDFGMNLIKNVCKLIEAISEDLRYLEGLNLINLFPEEALILLSKDRQFVYSLAAFKEQKLSTIIAQKMIKN